MLALSPDSAVAEPSGFWEHLTNLGPLPLLLHILFGVSTVVAVWVIARRAALPWMLLASCAPYICASAAAHLGYYVNLMTLSGDVHLPKDVAVFEYPMALFKWGCLVSLFLITASFFRRQKLDAVRTSLPLEPR